MCQQIAIVLPPGGPGSTVPTAGPISLVLLGKRDSGELVYAAHGLERGGCLCGTMIGSAVARRTKPPPASRSWSTAKLARWQEQVAGLEAPKSALHPEEGRLWRELLSAALVDRPWAGMLWSFGADTTLLQPPIAERESTVIDDATLARMGEGELVRFGQHEAENARLEGSGGRRDRAEHGGER